MPVLSTLEKNASVIGRGINMLTAERPCNDYVKSNRIFNPNYVTIYKKNANTKDVDVSFDYSICNLAKSVSISVGEPSSAMAFSTFVKKNYKVPKSPLQEMVYGKITLDHIKETHYLQDDSYLDSLSTTFKNDLEKMEPRNLFNKYGTHIITEAGIGGSIAFGVIIPTDKDFGKNEYTNLLRTRFKNLQKDPTNSSYKSNINILLNRADCMVIADGGKEFSSYDSTKVVNEYSSWISSLDIPAKRTFCSLPNINCLKPIWDFLPGNSRRRSNIYEYYYAEAEKIKKKLDAYTRCIHLIRINSDPKKVNARVCEKGWVLVDQDLNQGCKGNYIYLSYLPRYKKDDCDPIYDLMMIMENKAVKWSSKIYNLDRYRRIDTDLNEKAGGKYVYLCFTDVNRSFPPLSSITAYVDSKRPTCSDWNNVCWAYSSTPADANIGAGGKYIYLLQKHIE
ncbi:MAC/perforin domain-containing protein [Butyrivibrio proteoclasticus]|uniref:MAC/perforin domain-containing protein n=1 Tax=Butyrivibrio proteoclasticus TaxID=43305 RepID=UPI00047EAF6E|nr:MAC/perforin domain-containing protein [Butyrivibrio proteoclasticus]